jgi:hypothetical protein
MLTQGQDSSTATRSNEAVQRPTNQSQTKPRDASPEQKNYTSASFVWSKQSAEISCGP